MTGGRDVAEAAKGSKIEEQMKEKESLRGIFRNIIPVYTEAIK